MSTHTITHLLVSLAFGACAMVAPGLVGEASAAGTCEEINKTFQSECAASLPNRGTSPDAWFARVSGFAGVYTSLMSKEAEANACVEQGELYSKWKKNCDSQKEKVGKEWAEYVAWMSKDSLQFDTLLGHMEKRQRWDQAISSSDHELAKLEKIKELNAKEGLRADLTALDARIARIQERRAVFQAAHEEKIASVRCPKKGKKNKRHFKTVKAHFLADPEFAKTVKSLRVTGKSSSKFDYGKQTTFETLPLTICVQDDKPETPKCYVWDTSVQRSKVKGGRWSKWDTVLVGGREEMLCKNLK